MWVMEVGTCLQWYSRDVVIIYVLTHDLVLCYHVMCVVPDYSTPPTTFPQRETAEGEGEEAASRNVKLILRDPGFGRGLVLGSSHDSHLSGSGQTFHIDQSPVVISEFPGGVGESGGGQQRLGFVGGNVGGGGGGGGGGEGSGGGVWWRSWGWRSG